MVSTSQKDELHAAFPEDYTDVPVDDDTAVSPQNSSQASINAAADISPVDDDAAAVPTKRAKKISPVTAGKRKVNSKIVDGNSNTSTPPNQEKLSDADKQRIIAEIISTAQKNIGNLPIAERRGIEDDTFRHFKVGCSSKWRHSTMPDSMPTPRVIFPLGDEKNIHAYNAVMTKSGREQFKNAKRKRKEFEKCLTDGGKFVFNPEALSVSIFAVTEGEWDTVSIWQAIRESGRKLVCDELVGICALGGTGGATKDLIKRLKELDRKPRLVIILFDGDDNRKDGEKPGRTLAEELQKKLWEIGIVAVKGFFEDVLSDDEKAAIGDKPDANKILTTKGNEFLYRVFSRVVKKALDDAKQATTEMESWREHMQAANNSNDTDVPSSSSKKRKNQSITENPDFKKLKADINTTITHTELEAKGYLQHSEKGSAQPDGYCCPWCNSGNGSHKTGALKFITDKGDPHFGCGKCSRGGSVLTFLAKVKGKDTQGEEFIELVKETADEFNIPYDPQIFERKPTSRATNTTKAFVADCPLELKFPAGIEFEGMSIKVNCGTANKPKFVTAAWNLILPTKKFVNDCGGNVRYEVSIQKPKGEWKRTVVSKRELIEPSKVYALADYDANIANATATAMYFSKLFAVPENEDIIPEITIYNRPGWHGDKFIYPTPDNGENYIVERNGIDYASIFTTKGDKDEWLSKFREIVNGNQSALKRIVIGACLLAPMLPIIKIPNPQFNLWGSSNHAKTPLPKFGLSIYGDPSEGAMLRTWNATAKNMMAMSAAFNCFPLMVDEGESMSKRTQAELSEYVYTFTSGIIGQANKRNGDVRQTDKFNSVRFSTAERPLNDSADKKGKYKRLIDLHVTKPLFNDNDARQLHIFCEGNFGHFGRQWTRYIANNKKQIRADFEDMTNLFDSDGFMRDGIHAEYKSVDASNARSVIACAVAYQHFCVCLDLEEQFYSSKAHDDAAVILAQLPTVDEISDLKRSIQLLASWVAEHPKQFITPAKVNGEEIDGMDDAAQSFTSTVGKKFADGRIAFFTNAFRKIIAEIGLPSYEKVLFDLYDADYLDCKSSREKCKVVKIDDKPQRAYVVKSEAFSVKDGDEDS